MSAYLDKNKSEVVIGLTFIFRRNCSIWEENNKRESKQLIDSYTK